MTAKIIVSMNRSQTGDLGTVHPGVPYALTKANKATFEAYKKRGFCDFLTEKEFEKLTGKSAAKAIAATGTKKPAKAAAKKKPAKGATPPAGKS